MRQIDEKTKELIISILNCQETDAIYIFGSYGTEYFTEDSDIDIVVEVEKPTLSLMHNLHEALSKLFNTKVDLVRFRKSLRPLLQSNINQEAVYV